MVVIKIIQNNGSQDIWALKRYCTPKNTNIYLLGVGQI